MVANTARISVSVAANAIATYLVENGVLSIGDQISAIRLRCASPWRIDLLHAGFDAVANMSIEDIADGVDLALSRLLDAAQTEYDARGEAT